MTVFGFGFDDGDREVAPIAENIIGAFLFTARGAAAHYYDPAIGKRDLFTDLVIVPSGVGEFWQDVSSAGIGF